MENNENSDVHALGKGARGTSWTRQEIRCLMSVWGDAEVKYCVSSLRRNIHIFSYMSAELRKRNIQRSAIEIRTKTKLLRRDFKRAIAQNSRSGGSPSEFIWMDEMQRIFRGDPSIQPHRTTESEPPRLDGSIVTPHQSSRPFTEPIADVEEHALQYRRPHHNETASDMIADELSTNDDPQNASSSSSISDRSSTEAAHNREPDVATPEETMDPASRIAQMRRRKKRASAATKLDDTLNNYFDWIKSANKENQTIFKGAVETIGNLMKSAIRAFNNEPSSSRTEHVQFGYVEDFAALPERPPAPHPALKKVVRSLQNCNALEGANSVLRDRSIKEHCEIGSVSSPKGCQPRNSTVRNDESASRQNFEVQNDLLGSRCNEIYEDFDVDPAVLDYGSNTDVESEKDEEEALNKSQSLLSRSNITKLRDNVMAKGRGSVSKSKCNLLENKQSADVNVKRDSMRTADFRFDLGRCDFLTSTPVEDFSIQKPKKAGLTSGSSKDPYVVVKDENCPRTENLNVTPVKRLRKPRVVYSPL